MKWTTFIVAETAVALLVLSIQKFFPDAPAWVYLSVATFLALGVVPPLVWPYWRNVLAYVVSSFVGSDFMPMLAFFSVFLYLGIWSSNLDPIGERKRLEFWHLWTRPLFDQENLHHRMIVQECEFQAKEAGKIDKGGNNSERATVRFRWCLQSSGIEWERCVEGTDNCAAFGHDDTSQVRSMFVDDSDLRSPRPEWVLPKEALIQRPEMQAESAERPDQ